MKDEADDADDDETKAAVRHAKQGELKEETFTVAS